MAQTTPKSNGGVTLGGMNGSSSRGVASRRGVSPSAARGVSPSPGRGVATGVKAGGGVAKTSLDAGAASNKRRTLSVVRERYTCQA